MYFFAFHIKPYLKWIFFWEVLSLTELLVAYVISSIISNMPDTQFTQVCNIMTFHIWDKRGKSTSSFVALISFDWPL